MRKKFVFRTRKPCASGLIHEWTFYPQISSIQLRSWFADSPSELVPFTESPIWMPSAEFLALLDCTRENVSFQEVTT
jgi:hypothetical protein